MSIQKVKDPRTKKEIVLVEGKITGIYFNELKTIKTYANDWTPTHSVNIVVDGSKVGLGLTDREVLSAKDADDAWHDLVKGVEVSIEVVEGEYNGKPQYNATTKDVLVVDASGAETAQQTQSAAPKQTYAKKDMSGVSTGHGINMAFNLLAGEAVDNAEGVIELAKKCHDLTQSLKAEYATKNPDMSEYDLGAMVGQSVLSASNVTDFDSLEAVARDTLDKIVPQVSAYVKGVVEEKASAPKKTVAKKTVAKKTTAKTTTQEAPVQEPDDFVGDGYNLDDGEGDLPF